MANSGTVTAGVSAVQASQYNNLRDDILDPSTGHDHSGAADCGKLLTHESMESRTRSFFVPALGGIYRTLSGTTWSGYADLVHNGAYGINMGFELDEQSEIYGKFIVPIDYLSDLAFRTIVYFIRDSPVSYNILGRNYCATRTVGTAWSTTGTADTDWTAMAATANRISGIGSISLIGTVLPLDIGYVNFARDCYTAGDTAYADLYVAGWEFSYTADM